jgi:5-methylcytosine-specific restriction protein A
MNITLEQTKLAYKLSKDYYDGIIKRQEAISRLKNSGMNVGSAAIYLQVYEHLKDGETFTRTLKAESFDFFLDRLLNDFGNSQLLKALTALKNHIDYYESTHNGKLLLIRELHTKYSKIYSSIEDAVVDEEEETSFPEGKELYRLHRSKERNVTLVKIAKAKYLEINKGLSCQVCDFSFEENFGELGKGFIEAHHVFPISKLTEETATKIEDLAFVCSNCHRMLHRRRPWLGIEELNKMKADKVSRQPCIAASVGDLLLG